MKKKNGFTLAEVLITLAIIGVVATLTLPALMSNTQEQQAITGFRKAMNTLNEVGQMNAAIDGFDYGGIATKATPGSSSTVYSTSNGTLEQTVWAMMASKSQVDMSKSGKNVIDSGECKDKEQIFFRDGTVLCYTDKVTNDSADTAIEAVIDTNGIKAPNALSECGDINCKADSKKIKDQFLITLHGSVAIPGKVTFSTGTPKEDSGDASKAARWAMRK